MVVVVVVVVLVLVVVIFVLVVFVCWVPLCGFSGLGGGGDHRGACGSTIDAANE